MHKENLINYYLISPLEVRVDSSSVDDYNTGYDLELMPSSVLADKLSVIRNMIKASLIEVTELINLMDYIGEYHSANHEVIKQKTAGFMPDIQMVNGEVLGVGHLYCREELSQQELDDVRRYIRGQYSDGWGEGFEQQPVKSEYGDLYVSFWSPGESYSITAINQQQWEELTRPAYLEPNKPER